MKIIHSKRILRQLLTPQLTNRAATRPGQDGADEYLRDKNLILASLETQSERIEKLVGIAG